jgi:serine/threonine protein kinase/tetratricopeptide (TPR) repeat protein
MNDMSPAEAVFFAALEKTHAAERAAYLDEVCAGKPELRARVEKLLAAQARVGKFLDSELEREPIKPFLSASPEATGPATPESGVAGDVIAGKYKLLQEIGEGGMGSVWMADQTEPVKRRVAVKLIRTEKTNSKTILARFEAERQAIALMDHPNVAKLLDAGTTAQGQPFFVMELVKGIQLTEYCDIHKLSVVERLGLFVQICSAVQHAHQKGIIHRDLKPRNILVESHDGKPVPKVIDFGLAKATSGMQLTLHTLFTGFGTVMGTPLYMAPEQATFNATDIDTRADVYALGVILYELLTGTTPLTHETVKKAAFDEVLKLIREQEAPTPSSRLSSSESAPSVAANRQIEPARLGRLIKGDLDWIVLKSLSKDRDRRYETAISYARDIERFLNHEAVTAGPPTAMYRFRKFVRRNRGQVVAGSLVLMSLVFGVIGTTVGLLRADARRLEAVQAQMAEAAQRAEAEKQKQRALKAAEEEQKARASEFRRAEGEKEAKNEARLKQIEAERNLAYAKKGNEILGSVFAGLDPRAKYTTLAALRIALGDNLKKAVKELEGSSIGNPLEVATMQVTLGTSLLSLGEASLSVEVLLKALATRESKLGPDHSDTIESMNMLASAYLADGQLKRAAQLLELTLEKEKVKFGPDHPNTLVILSNLATVYQRSGQLTRAVPLFEEALNKQKVNLGPDHHSTLSNMSNLASAYRASGQYAKAIAMFEETLEKMNAKFGPDHSDTLIIMGNLALAYRDIGQPAKAIPLLEATLKKQKATLGADHPDTLTSTANLALAYRDSGQLDKALPILEVNLEKMIARHGPDHPQTLGCMNILAAAYRASGLLAKAVPLQEEALEKMKAKLGPEHLETLVCMNNLALAYGDLGQFDRAIKLLEETLEKRKVKLGPDHPYTVATLGNLGKTYAKAKEGELATNMLVAFVDANRRLGKKDSLEFAGLLAQVSTDLLGCGQYAASESLLRECHTIREKTQPNLWNTFNTKSMLGEALWGQKKYAEAESFLLKGYEGLVAREKTIPPAGSIRIPEALDRLIELYIATNKADEVKKWRTERAKYPFVAPKPREKK